jgi:hypothetical protein
LEASGRPPTPGGRYYAISMAWLDEFCAFVGFKLARGGKRARGGARPGPIDNRPIADAEDARFLRADAVRAGEMCTAGGVAGRCQGPAREARAAEMRRGRAGGCAWAGE